MGASKARRFIFAFAVMSLFWMVLTGGDPKTLWFGFPAGVVAAAISLRLTGGQGFRVIRGLPSFIPFFVYQSLKGGLDVTARALNPRMPLQPAILSYHVRLPEGPPSIFFRGVMGLFPGTLAAGLEEGRLIVHALDGDLPVMKDLELIEEHVGRLFGEAVSRHGESSDT